MMWTQFFEVFLEKYVPHSFKERLKDEFTDLMHRSMLSIEYEV